MPIQYEDQGFLAEKFQKYLNIVSQERPAVYDSSTVDTLSTDLSEGMCNGLTGLWLYYKKRGKADYFYNAIITPILSWNGKKETLSPELKETIEYALSSISLLQANIFFERMMSGIPTYQGEIQSKPSILQSDYDALLALSKQDDYPTLKKEYGIAFALKDNELATIIEGLAINKLVRLESDDHTIGLFFDTLTQEYILFDPNGFRILGKRVFEKRFAKDKLNDLILAIQKSFSYSAVSDITGVNISFFGNENDSENNSIEDFKNKIFIVTETLNESIVKRFKNAGEVDASNPSNNASSLYFAAKNGDTGTVKWLLAQGADAGKKTKTQWGPIHIASQNGHVEVVEALLNSKMGDKLLNASRKPNVATPITIAAYNGRVEVVKLLLRHGANINSALHRACEAGQVDVATLLLNTEMGQKLIDTPSTHSTTPLFLAVANGHLETVQLLIERGANPTLLSDNGWGAIHMAAQNGYSAIAETLLTSKMRKILIDPLPDGITPLYIASQHGRLEVVKSLLKAMTSEEQTALIDAPFNDKTPLYIAIQNGHRDIAEHLLTLGAQLQKNWKTTLLPEQWASLMKLSEKNGFQERSFEETAKKQVPKNWIDKDYAHLIKIRAEYARIEKQIHLLDLEVMELSEYFEGFRGKPTRSVIDAKLNRLEKIEQEVDRLKASVDFKTHPISVDNNARKEELLSQSNTPFKNLLKDIKRAKEEGIQAKATLPPPPSNKQSP